MARLPLALSLLVFTGCTSPLMVGQECTDSADCGEGLSCFYTDATMSRAVCMQDCDDSMTRLCPGGEVCVPASAMGAPRDEEVCFLGGDTPIGSPCADLFECVAGSICVIVGGDQRCYQACDTADGSACASTETCEGLEDMGTKGYCQPMAP